MEQVILGIDIGSSKICSLIAEVKGGMQNIIGIGVQGAKGIRKGAIADIEQASRSIKDSVNDAKRIAGANVSSAIISLSGVYAKSINSTGIINNPHGEIGIQEINRVMQTALYNANIPNNHEVVHVLPYLFKVDGREYIDDPFGMSGSRLEVEVHIITAQKSGLQNLKKAVNNAGIEVNSIVLNAYASSISTLRDDEKELGVACIDMGASSCDIMIHQGNSMKYDDFLGVGSMHITNDITIALATPPAVAENIKVNYATLYDLTPEELEYSLEVPAMGENNATRNVSLEIIHNVVFSRVLETLQIIDKSLTRSGLINSLGAGVVITGGMATMKGMRELASNVFHNMPIRIANPKEMNGSFEQLKDPAFATVIGLILYGTGKYTNYELDMNKKLKYNQNKTTQQININTPSVKDGDLSDLEMTRMQINKKEEITDVRIKLDKGKNKFWANFINLCKNLF